MLISLCPSRLVSIVLTNTTKSFASHSLFRRYRNGCKIRSSGSCVHKHFDRSGTATLALVDQDDVTGHYTCTAANEAGEASDSCTVAKRGAGNE